MLDKSIELSEAYIRLEELICEQEELEECGDLEDRMDICFKIDNTQRKIRSLEAEKNI
jgi:hypothetical protein